MFKLGFEYEGVIYNNEGKICIFNDMPVSARKNIINDYCKKPSSDKMPVDRYVCLAEIKTNVYEFENVDNRQINRIIIDLFEEIDWMNTIFKRNGYKISWYERKIPEDVHYKILKYFDKSIDIKPDKYQNKVTYTIKSEDDHAIPFKSKDNRLRGGGFHVTMSGDGLQTFIDSEFIWNLHQSQKKYNPYMRSVYRENLLFRKKMVDDTYLFEYMSMGVQLYNDLSKVQTILILKERLTELVSYIYNYLPEY